jgi:hypothetical protein
LGPWCLLTYVGILINLIVSEFVMIVMIVDPVEVQYDALEEIDPDLVS